MATIVIGAGHNGLVAASLLAKSGRKVTVFEQSERAGGVAAGWEFHPGYHTAGLLHETNAVRKRVLDELSLQSHGVGLRPEEPPVFAPSLEGQGVLVGAGVAGEDTGLSAEDREKLGQFRTFLSRVGDALRPVLNTLPPDVVKPPAGELLSLLKTGLSLRRLGKSDLMEFLRMGPMCVADVLNEWFDDPVLKALLAAPAVRGSFTGPWSPGTALMLPLQAAGREHGGVIGGSAAFASALEARARELGVEIRTGARVTEILLHGGRVTGVSLADGSSVAAERVLSTCDPKQTFLSMIPPTRLPLGLYDEARTIRSRGTTARVTLALSGPLEFSCRPGKSFERIRIAEHVDDIEKAYDAAKYGEIPEKPHLDIRVPTVSDPTLAPGGHHVVSILAHFVPFHRKGGWDDAARKEVGERVVARLKAYAPSVMDRIVSTEVLTPQDLADRYGLTEGHVDHGEHAMDQLLFMRPAPSCARYATPIQGLFVGGSGAHPGGGITGAPGWLAARAMG